VSEADLKRFLPTALASKISGGTWFKGFAIGLGKGAALVVEDPAENRFSHVRVQAAHEHQGGVKVDLDLEEESDGTRRLLDLIPALHQSRRGSGVFFVDEIDRSLHPILARKFIEFFLRSGVGGQAQLIVTTHESSLLDQDLLRRDEIWFAEKDGAAATHLYSLSEFKVRNDAEIRKHYLQGRFGAIPFVGGFDQLMGGPGKADESGSA
jgi:AAA15 family ATPase/GTPase